MPVLITAWFDNTTKGKALGIAFAGGSLGNIFLQQMVVKQIASVGPSKAYINFSIMSLIVGVLVSLFLINMPHQTNKELPRNKLFNFYKNNTLFIINMI